MQLSLVFAYSSSNYQTCLEWSAIAQSEQLLGPSWTVRGSISGGREIFRTRLDRPWGPPSLLFNRYRVSFPGVNLPGRGVDNPSPFSGKVKKE